MKTQLKKRTCDQCKKTETSDDVIRYGGQPDFIDWIELHLHETPPGHINIYHLQIKDFCSPKCAIAYLQGEPHE